MSMSVPKWVRDAVFYQIFPDRFANGNKENDPYNVKPWLEKPSTKGFHGGDLQGVIQKFDYLIDLGINAIYFNPIFQAASTHRYDTYDYFSIDPILGNINDFQALLKVAHDNQVKVVIDGVFNHCGRGFFAFNNILENGQDSPYLNWFHIKNLPLDAYSPGEARNYLGWWGYKSLPKFNTDEPEVRQYLLDVARYWIELGADGWRLDVPNEIDDDEFWADFRSTVKTANPEAYILGEIWDGNPRWVGDDHFDGLMNYPIRDAVFDVIKKKNGISQFAERVEELLEAYPFENVQSMLVLLGSHDTRRIRRKMDGDMERVKLAYLFPFVYPGAPCIYYGDEIGLDGGKDPDCRRTFPWDTSLWNQSMLNWIKKLIEIRHQEEALRRGKMDRIFVDEQCYIFKRYTPDESLIVALNFGEQPSRVEISVLNSGDNEASSLKDLISGEEFQADNGMFRFDISTLSGMILKPVE